VLTFPGDVGGQKTLRTYWKNYFEKTDTLIWVVDATDRERIDDCRQELEGLLQEEVRHCEGTFGLPLTVGSG
jgi:GTPase SAR1 family protein